MVAGACLHASVSFFGLAVPREARETAGWLRVC